MTKEEVDNIYNLLTSDNLHTALRIILDLEPEEFKFCMEELMNTLSVYTYKKEQYFIIYNEYEVFWLNADKQKFKIQNNYLIKNLL